MAKKSSRQILRQMAGDGTLRYLLEDKMDYGAMTLLIDIVTRYCETRIRKDATK